MGGPTFRIVIEYECSRKHPDENDKSFTYCTVFRMLLSCVRNVTNDDDVSTMAQYDVGD